MVQTQMAVRFGAMATAAAAWLVMAAPPAAAQASEDFWGTARMWSVPSSPTPPALAYLPAVCSNLQKQA